jgi:4-aminobutyrate aminotransferase-like enzyme
MAKDGEWFSLVILMLLILKQALDCWNYFGGSHLACAASIAVLDVIEEQNLMANASKVETYFLEAIKVIQRSSKRKRIDARCRI